LKTKKQTFIYILIGSIMMIIISCGPSKEEREALEKPIIEEITNGGLNYGVAYVEIEEKDRTNYKNRPPSRAASLVIIMTLIKFKKENPAQRITSFDVQYHGGGTEWIYPIGILINFEPKEIPILERHSTSTDDLSEDLSEGIISIPRGGTLCGSLGMTEKEALDFAKANNIKYWYEGKILKVDIHPEDWIQFKTKVVKEWKKVKPFHHNRGHS